MMKKKFFSALLRPLALGGATLFAGGCITGPSQAPEIFFLSPLAEKTSPQADFLQGRSFHVGQTEIPSFLEGKRIASRLSPTQLDYSDFHLWSETLDLGVSRVVANNLANTLGTLHFSYTPNRPRSNNQVQVFITVEEFAKDPAGQIILKGTWRLLLDRKQVFVLPLNESVAVEGEGHDAMVKAMNSVLLKVSDQLASRLIKHFNTSPSPATP
jgi:uncharacterized lipoprotein YmbA